MISSVRLPLHQDRTALTTQRVNTLLAAAHSAFQCPTHCCSAQPRILMTQEIDQYLQIVADIEQAYKTAVKENREQHQSSKAYKIDTRVFWFGMIAPSIVAVLIAPFSLIASLSWTAYVSWGLIGVSYLVLLIYPLLGMWLYRDSIRKVLTAPFASLMQANVKTIMQIDAQYLPKLVSLPCDTLKLGIVELKNERSALEKRTHLVTGAIEKIGIFPGLLALAVGLTALSKTLSSAGIMTARLDWVFALAGANIIFYFMCAYSQIMMSRYERMVALTELAIERINSQSS
ncbi:hypothetical protein [Pseudomonas syringae group genomosp. 3]|nr:hypothetical protein [Pseudomonas syringae group genomosp. 3]